MARFLPLKEHFASLTNTTYTNLTKYKNKHNPSTKYKDEDTDSTNDEMSLSPTLTSASIDKSFGSGISDDDDEYSFI